VDVQKLTERRTLQASLQSSSSQELPDAFEDVWDMVRFLVHQARSFNFRDFLTKFLSIPKSLIEDSVVSLIPQKIYSLGES